MQLEGRVTVVTGGASGIGKAVCERYAAEGARGVVVTDRNAPGAEEVAAAINETAPGRAAAFGCDVSQESEVNELVAFARDQFGEIDVFFSNAGIASGGDPLAEPLDVWQEQWDVNLMAHVYATRAVLPAMLERGDGYLLHTASMAGILSTHGNLHYAVSKHAVVGLAEWLAFTYQHRGIKVSCLCPLGVRTPMLGPVDSEWARAAAGNVREPEEVAQMVVDAMAEEQFLITTDAIAQQWMVGKTADPDRWIAGMNRLQQKIENG